MLEQNSISIYFIPNPEILAFIQPPEGIVSHLPLFLFSDCNLNFIVSQVANYLVPSCDLL